MANIQNPENKKLSDFEVLNFDVYGTLIDWESGVIDALGPLLSKSPDASKWSRRELLEAFAELETKIQRANPSMLYSTLLSHVHSELASQLGLESTPTLDDAFGQSVRSWTPFPDTCEALAVLSEYYNLVVLSNVDNETFGYTQKLLESAGGRFSLVVTAQDVGSYKPDTKGFEYVLNKIGEQFRVGREKVLVTAQSLFHDHEPANKLGLASAWIARENGSIGATSPATYTFSFPTLGAMARARERE